MCIKEILELKFSNFNAQKNPMGGLLKSPGNQPKDSTSAGDFEVKQEFSGPLSDKTALRICASPNIAGNSLCYPRGGTSPRAMPELEKAKPS